MILSIDSDIDEIIILFILVLTIERRKGKIFKKDLTFTVEAENLASLATGIKATKTEDEIWFELLLLCRTVLPQVWLLMCNIEK